MMHSTFQNEKKTDEIDQIDNLIKIPPYSLNYSEKNEILLPIIKNQVSQASSNIHIQSMFNKLNVNIQDIFSLENIPIIPVQMFKKFDLSICPEKDIIRTVRSSGTTGQQASRIPLNKNTAFRQTKALASILSDYLGSKRRILLIIDHDGMNKPEKQITARSAGIRGLSIYSKKIYYLLKEEKNGKLQLNIDAINEVIKNHSNEEVFVFGFTYIIWSEFVKKIKDKNIKFKFKDVKIFHSGGWKKMIDEAVTKKRFSDETAKIFNTSAKNVYDFYGMAEQTGVIFVDCEYGNKHVPNFAKVIIRDFLTQEPCNLGETGLIEVMSILSDSYYSQAILTEDTGYLIGVDDCPCGRKGEYFRFKKRIEKAEIRGCGDTFKEKL